MANVKIESLEMKYTPKGKPAVPNLDLEVQEGEFLTLLGPSGCGKTTTLRCVAGLEKPTGGRISIGGEVVDDPANRRHVPPNRRDIGMVFQSYALWPHMTVAANVGYPLRMRKTPSAERTRRVSEALELVGLGEFATRMSSDLSGGQQQRVALARALVAEPRLLLFDEPLSNLDARLRKEMRSELRDMHRRVGTTSLYVTHDQEEAVSLSSRIVLLNKGEIEQVGSPREIYWQPVSRFVADFVGYDSFLTGTVVSADQERLTVRLDGTEEVFSAAPKAGIAEGQEVEMAVRSSAVLLGQDAEAEPNRFEAEVIDRVYLGEEFQYTLRTGPQEIGVTIRTAEIASLFPQGAPQVGETVTAALPVASIACLPRES